MPQSDLEEMLHRAHQLGRGPAKWAVYDSVFRHADAAGLTEFAYRARMDALNELHHQGEYARAFLAFSSCLATFDRHPELTRGYDEHTLLWRFKWIVWALSQFSGVPLERALALLDDMERRYRAGNHSLHAVHQHRALVATHLGDLDGAAHWFGEMRTARRDSLSDCAACVPTSEVEFLVARGEFEEAVRVGSPYAHGGCTEQPQQMLSQLLLPYLRTGQTEKAVDAHRRAYPRIRDNRHYLELAGLHVQFCALTGNTGYGLTIVERHLPWLDKPASPYAAMEFSSAAALLLSGLGDTPVQRRTDSGDRRWESTATETYAELTTLARSLAAEFDARNGNTHQSNRVEARLAAEPLLDELPLTVLAGREIPEHEARAATASLVRKVATLTAEGDLAGAARAQLEVAYTLRNAGQLTDATETAEEARRSLDRAGLVAEAAEARYLLAELYRGGQQRRAMLLELVDLDELPGSLPSRPELLIMAADSCDGAEAVALFLEAADSADDRATETRALVGMLRYVDTPGTELVERLDALDVAEDPYVQDGLCRLEELDGRLDAALARAQRLPGDHAELRLREASLLLRLDRPAEAVTVAETLLEGEYDWEAITVVVRALQAQGLDPASFLAEHNLDLDDLDD